LAAELAQHLIGNAIRSSGSGDGGERVDSSRDAPLPFNQAAFDDANELYSALVYWSVTWAQQMRTPAPDVAQGAWRNARGTIVGLPLDVAPATAATLVGTLARWIKARLDTILAAGRPDDVDAMTDTMADIWRINARWPRIEKPSYSAMPCPRQECGAKIAVYPPAFPGDDRRIVCTAGHWYPDEEYEHLRLLFADVAKDRARTERTARHLIKKHGISTGRNQP
jgi:hypothetical protein